MAAALHTSQVATILTVVMVGAWIAARLVKLFWVHDLSTPVIDGLIGPVIIGWFGAMAVKANGKKSS